MSRRLDDMDVPGIAPPASTAGQAGSGLLIVIPCYDELELLKKHLIFLSKQSFQAFDALLVLGIGFPDDELAKFLKDGKFQFNAFLAKRKEDTGSAGGFFTGQKHAIGKKYPFIILADVDCMPEDARLVESLYKNRGKLFVSPSVHFIDEHGNRSPVPQGDRDARTSTSHYTLLSAGLFEKYGLYFSPLYCGYEDAEYRNRIREPRHFIGNFCAHPGAKAAFFAKPEKGLAYSANQALFSPPSLFPRFALVMSWLLATLVLFHGRRGRALAARFFKAIFKKEYGRQAAASIASGLQGQGPAGAGAPRKGMLALALPFIALAFLALFIIYFPIKAMGRPNTLGFGLEKKGN